MKLSTKGRYAMVALADMALQPEDRWSIWARFPSGRNISLPYLEQLFVKLRRKGWWSRCGGQGAVQTGQAGERDPHRRNPGRGRRDGERHAQGRGGARGTVGVKGAIADQRLWEGFSAHVYVFLHQTRLSDVVSKPVGALSGGAVAV